MYFDGGGAMFPFFFDPTMMLLIPALLLAMWAQMRVKSVFAQYSAVGSRRGVTAASAARAILDRFGLQAVPVNRVEETSQITMTPGTRASAFPIRCTAARALRP